MSRRDPIHTVAAGHFHPTTYLRAYRGFAQFEPGTNLRLRISMSGGRR